MVKRIKKFFKEPAKKRSAGFVTTAGVFLGVLLWGGFNWSLEVTNTEEFCISCHEMENYVFEEYKDTIHYTNGSGVRATCPDCHVPKEWGHKMVRKIYATNELLHHFLRSIETPEKFENKRLYMARRVWNQMEKTDSRECRNCHDNESMDFFEQGVRGVERHIEGEEEGKTCIECHRGIAHSLPALYEEDPSAVIGHREGP